jgi:hypothetical protein
MARTTKQDSVRELQRTLYRAAKADPGRRFHALYDKVYRRDVMEWAWELAFTALLRHAKPFLAPQALHPLAVDAPALLEQMLMRLAVPPPWPLARERPQLGPERRVVLRDDRLPPLRGPRLSDDSARPPLRDAQAVLQHADRPAPARRAHQFPFAISFNA